MLLRRFKESYTHSLRILHITVSNTTSGGEYGHMPVFVRRVSIVLGRRTPAVGKYFVYTLQPIDLRREASTRPSRFRCIFQSSLLNWVIPPLELLLFGRGRV